MLRVLPWRLWAFTKVVSLWARLGGQGSGRYGTVPVYGAEVEVVLNGLFSGSMEYNSTDLFKCDPEGWTVNGC